MWIQESLEWPQQSCQAQLPPRDPVREKDPKVSRFHTVTLSQLQRSTGWKLPARGPTGAWPRASSERGARLLLPHSQHHRGPWVHFPRWSSTRRLTLANDHLLSSKVCSHKQKQSDTPRN